MLIIADIVAAAVLFILREHQGCCIKIRLLFDRLVAFVTCHISSRQRMLFLISPGITACAYTVYDRRGSISFLAIYWKLEILYFPADGIRKVSCQVEVIGEYSSRAE